MRLINFLFRLNLGSVAVAAGLLLAPREARCGALLQDGDLLAICGDSITQQRLYTVYIEAYLLACQPAADLQAVQFGWGGERMGGLNSRFESNIAPFKPMVATTCYGMNDGRYAPITDEVLKEYRAATTVAVKKFKQAGVREIVVGAPGVVDPASFNRRDIDAAGYNRTLSALAGVAREVAAAEKVHFADVHGVMLTAMTKAKAAAGDGYVLARDGVHPQPNGHLPMAHAFLKALGCDGGIGRIEHDFSTGKTTVDAGQELVESRAGRMTIESRRYPFCFTGKTGDRDLLTMLDFLPFDAELNRYLLVVKNAPARAKVNWGGESREFSAEQLALGVNLAMEFRKNPFAENFERVIAAVQAQQDFEVPGIKGMLYSLPEWRKALPEKGELFEELRGSVLEKDEALRKAARAAVTPVRHGLVIEAAR